MEEAPQTTQLCRRMKKNDDVNDQLWFFEDHAPCFQVLQSDPYVHALNDHALNGAVLNGSVLNVHSSSSRALNH